MRSFLSLLLLSLCLAVVVRPHPVDAGWFGGSSSDSNAAILKRKLADAEKEANIKAAEAKASAKKYKAGIEEQTSKAKKEAEKRAKVAKAEASGFFAKKKQQVKNLFN